jgi:hypothetical protein
MARAFAQDLPADPTEAPLDFEPQLILTDPDPVELRLAPAENVDTAKLEAALARARQTAEKHVRLHKQGILAKVEAERSALRVVALTKSLSEARLAEAKANVASVAEGTPEAKAAAAEALAKAEAACQADTEALLKAQLEAASLNLWRQQKLQAWGGASKAAVARAQEQVAAAQRQLTERTAALTSAPAK